MSFQKKPCVTVNEYDVQDEAGIEDIVEAPGCRSHRIPDQRGKRRHRTQVDPRLEKPPETAADITPIQHGNHAEDQQTKQNAPAMAAKEPKDQTWKRHGASYQAGIDQILFPQLLFAI